MMSDMSYHVIEAGRMLINGCHQSYRYLGTDGIQGRNVTVAAAITIV